MVTNPQLECEHTLSVSIVLILCDLFGLILDLNAGPYSINNKVSVMNGEFL